MAFISIGVTLLLTPFAFMYSLAGFIVFPSGWRKYFPFYIITISVLAYSYNPVGSPDLVRYFAMLDDCRSLSFKETINYFHDGLICNNFMFWFFGHLGDNNLLTCFSVTVVYSIATFITCDLAELNNETKSIPAVLLYQLLTLPFISIANNIRNVLAFSIIVFAAYQEIVKKRRNLYILLLYLIPCFLHTSAVILVVFRLLIIVITPKNRTLALSIIFILPMLINLLYSNIGIVTGMSSIARVIRSAIIKGYWYLNDKDTTEWARSVAQSGTSRATRFLLMVLVSMMIILIYNNTRKQLELYECRNFNSYLLMISIMTLACNIFTTPHYWRFAAACNIMSSTALIPALKEKKRKRGPTNIALTVLFCGMFISFMLYIRSSRYNTNYIDLFSGFLINNIYVVICNVIKGIYNFNEYELIKL